MRRARSRSGISDRDEEVLVLSQMFRSLANSGTIQRKGWEVLAKSGASVVDQSNLGQGLKNTKGPLLQ